MHEELIALDGLRSLWKFYKNIKIGVEKDHDFWCST
jgi:hypothetical protein